jgi:predicted nuclease with TOPRIM domain
MEDLEQLKQNNEKLTERLNNAAKFFREQKAQIEALTKENEQLKNDNNVKDDSIRLNNELLETVENLKKEKEELEKKFKEQQNFEANNINTVVPQLEEKVTHLEEVIKSKDQAYNVLQNTYNELFGENTRNKEEIQKRIDQIRATEKTYDEEQKKIIDARDEWMSKYQDLEQKYKDIQQSNEDKIKDIIMDHKQEVADVENQSKKIMESYETDIKKQKDEITALNIQLGETEETLNKFNIRYENLENEKLAIQADFDNLQEKYNVLQQEYNILENKTEIYSVSDTVLAEVIKLLTDKGLVNKNDITPQTSTKETIHRIGDNMVSGENIGV